jgi:tetratricopeptide (TPR) repeat protein
VELIDLPLRDNEASSGRDKMQRATINNRFNINTLSLAAFSETGNVSLNSALYQQIAAKLIKGLYKTDAYIQLGNQFIVLADQALDLKQIDRVEQISHLLMNAPLPSEYQSIGEYYLACCVRRQGRYDEAHVEFERLAESPTTPLKFRARALQAIGAICFTTGKPLEALRFFSQATQVASPKYGNDLSTATYAQFMVAITKSMNGNSAEALADFRNLFPAVRLVALEHPLILYSYANSVAVELGEIGRIEEARQASQFAMQSAYAPLYPEWRETRDEIALKSRRASAFTVAVSARPAELNNVIPLTIKPLLPHNTALLPASNASQPTNVVGYDEWKKIASRLNQTPTQTKTFAHYPSQPTTKLEKQAALFKFIYHNDTSEEALDRLLQAAEIFEPDKPCG